MRKKILHLILSLFAKSFSNIFLIIFLSFYLNAEALVLLSIMLSSCTIITMVVEFGHQVSTPKVMQSSIALNDLVNTIISKKLVLVVPLFLVSFIYYFFFGLSNNIPLFEFLLMLFAMMFYSLYLFVLAVFRGCFRFDIEAKVSVITEVFVFVGVILTAMFTESLFFTVLCFFCLKFNQLAIAYYYLNKLVTTAFSFKCPSFSELLSDFPFFLQLFLSSIIIYIDSIMSVSYLSVKEADTYQLVSRIIILFSFMSTAIVLYMLPYLSRLYLENKQKFIKTIVKFGLLSIALSKFFFVFAYFVLSIGVEPVLGSRYKAIGELSFIVSFIIGIKYIVASLGVVLTTINYQWARVFSQTLAILCFIIFLGVSRVASIADFINMSALMNVVLLFLYGVFFFMGLKQKGSRSGHVD